MSRICFTLCCFIISCNLILTTAVFASESKDEAIRELLDVMNTMDNMEVSMNSMKDAMKMNSPYFLEEIKVILARELEGEDVRRAAKTFTDNDYGINRLHELFRNKFNLETVEKEIMLPVYREHYSEAEIRELTRFYRSDLGQKTLRLTPVISQTIAEKTRDISHMALSQAKEELVFELRKNLDQ